MAQTRADPVAAAAARLEAAVAELAAALARLPRPLDAEGDEMVPRAAVAAMADRLDATLMRLRQVLAEELRTEES